MRLFQGEDKTRSVRSVLVGLVVGVILPLLLLAIAYGTWNLRLQQDLMDRRLEETARALSLAVDREVQAIEALLAGLATSPYLDTGDFDAFRTQAADIVGSHGGWIVLTAPSMQTLVNTLRPRGEELPSSGSPDSVAAVMTTQTTVVSNVFVGRVAKRPIVAVFVPVIRDGRAIYALDIAFRPDRFSELLSEQNLPAGWVGSIVDRDNVYVAKSQDTERDVGRRAPPWFVDESAQSNAGLLQGRFPDDDDDVHLAFYRSARTGWKTIVTAPASVYGAPGRQAQFILSVAALISLGLALAAATLIGSRIARPLQVLAQQADAIIRGETVPPAETGVSEVAEVRRALDHAATAMQERIDARIRLAEERRARIAAEDTSREIRRRETALKESEERYRALVEATAAVVWTTGPDGEVLDMPQWRELTGQNQTEVAGWRWLDAVHPEDQERVRRAWQTCVEAHILYNVEYRIRSATGRYRWYNARGVPVLTSEGAVREWVGVCIDIDDRKAADQRQQLLMFELDHRVRNILASIQAMVSLTAPSAPTKEEYARRLQGRVAAMARTHGLLTRQKWKGASLREIMRDELRPYAEGEDTVALRGWPDCILRPREALNFALVIHELATNAAKHGALSLPSGRIDVDWHRDETPDGVWLRLEWRERGGPPVVPPPRRGFGSRLLESALGPPSEAAVELAFDPAGVRCRIDMRLQEGAEGTPGDAYRPQLATVRLQASNPGINPVMRVLVAEDEPLASIDIVSVLTALGWHIAGPATTVAEARAIAATENLGGAVLDVNLGGEMVYEVADLLISRGVPIILVTGYDAATMAPERLRHIPALQKPTDHETLVAQFRRSFGTPAKREAS